MKSSYEDKPRSLKDPEVKKERLDYLKDDSVRQLNDYVDELRQKMGKGEEIPYFDPMDGGVDAKCLFLFEAPGGKALRSSFVSRNNNDQTAENFFNMNREVNFDREATATWNVVPWALRESGSNRTPTKDEVDSSVDKHLHHVLDVVSPEVIVLFGNSAHRAEVAISNWSGEICLIKTNHPSPQNINRHKEMWEKITAALSRAKSCIS